MSKPVYYLYLNNLYRIPRYPKRLDGRIYWFKTGRINPDAPIYYDQTKVFLEQYLL